MAKTVNGYPVIEAGHFTGPRPRVHKWYVPASKGLKARERHLILRDGAHGFILMHFVLWFHEVIERLDINRVWDEWGHAVRPVRGQTSGFSNHAGGVAADLNATLHPQGVSVRKTFTRDQIRKIRFWVATKKYRDLLIWGGDWRTPDGMHVELSRASSKKVRRVARRLAKTKRGKRILAANPGINKNFLR